MASFQGAIRIPLFRVCYHNFRVTQKSKVNLPLYFPVSPEPCLRLFVQHSQASILLPKFVIQSRLKIDNLHGVGGGGP
jgi:hypothetical protein